MEADRRKVILLVEDEPQILRLLADFLEEEGYRTLAAEDAQQAFEILALQPRLDLLVTDYRLPGGISGVSIAEPALKLRPGLKIMFISGYPVEIVETGSPVASEAPVLAKPFALDHLQQTIEQLLSSG